MGARQLRPVLMHLKREVTKAQQGQPGPPQAGYMRTTSVAMLETFFALSWARFGQGWRPDVPPHLDRQDGRDLSVHANIEPGSRLSYKIRIVSPSNK